MSYVCDFPGNIEDLSMSPNGEFCCTISDDKSAKVFDVINFGKLNVNGFNIQHLTDTLHEIEEKNVYFDVQTKAKL